MLLPLFQIYDYTMKRIKKRTLFTKQRDLIRLISVFSFYGLVIIPHQLGYGGLEIESETIVLASILFLGSWFCGWVCPFGNVSYFMTQLGSYFFPSLQFQIPTCLHNKLKYLKYLFLIYFLGLFLVEGVNYFDDHILMYKSNWFTFAFLKFKHIAVLLIPIFIPRFFCKYLCFQKGAYNFLNLVFPSSFIHRNDSTCISCKKCDKVCPMQIKVSKKEIIAGNDCLSCFNCLDTDTCPPNHKSLSLCFFWKEVKPLKFGLVMSVLYFLISIFVLFV